MTKAEFIKRTVDHIEDGHFVTLKNVKGMPFKPVVNTNELKTHIERCLYLLEDPGLIQSIIKEITDKVNIEEAFLHAI